MADNHGNVVSLGERECSIQRRYQKVIEEAPSLAVDAALRSRMGEMACALAREAGYSNAGTVEFIMDSHRNFFFMEMNTRLQVEHPVTEAVTGLDLVRLQIEVAAGLPLPLAQEDVVACGHALECRLYAEDPANDDLPSPGRVVHFAAPEGPGIRFDGGIAAGCDVSVHYDPLLAKLVCWGRDRAESIERMSDALLRTVVLGVVTNLPRLQAIVASPLFREGALHTGFIDEHLEELSPRPCPPEEGLAAVAAVLARVGRSVSARAEAVAPDPWASIGPWRLGG